MKDRLIDHVGPGVTELGNDDLIRNIFTLQGFHFVVLQQLLQGLFVHFGASQRVDLKVDIKMILYPLCSFPGSNRIQSPSLK